MADVREKSYELAYCFEIGETVFIHHKRHVLKCEIAEINDVTGICYLTFMEWKFMRAPHRIYLTHEEAESAPTAIN